MKSPLVEDNHITDVYAGVYLSTNSGSLTVSGNRIENLPAGVGPDQGSAIVLEGNHLNVSVSGNELFNNAHGVFLFSGFGDDLDGTSVSDNSIVGNTAGITNNRATTLDASCNWWGDESGPSGIAGGDGDSVSAAVDFQPWRIAEGGACTGYTSPVVRDRDGAVFGSFTDAIADAGTLDGDTLIGAEAVYEESFTVNKALTITGIGAGTVIDGGMASSNGISIPGNQTDVTISNLRVQNFAGSCIRGGVGNNNTLIDTVEIANCDGPGAGGGIYFDGPVDNITITNSTITNANWRSIVIWNGFKTNITITDNIVTGNGGLCCGIELQDGTASGVTITGNVVTGHGDSGIGLTGLTGGAGPNLIANNTVTDNGRFGIEIKNPNGAVGDDENADGAIVVRDNTVALTGPVSDQRDLAGIAVFRRGVLADNVDIPTGVIVRNNTVSGYSQASDSDGFGIVVEGTQMRVFDNTLEDNDVGLQRQSGHEPYPGDGDQGNLADDYFGRGNSPVVCSLVGANQFTNNLVDERDVLQIGAEGPDPRVNNLDNGAFHCGIQSAIDAESTLAGHTLMVDPGSYEESLLVDKAINLVGDPDGLDRPVISFSGSVASGEETLVRVQSEDVTIDGFDLVVDQTFIGEAIRTEGDASGLVVRNNRISAVPSDPNSIVPFGIRNAIAVNTSGRPGTVGSGFGPVLIENNEIQAIPTGIGIGGFFRAGVAMDTVHGTLTGNDVFAATHDAIIRFVLGGNLVVHDNDFRGGGLQFNEFNATAPAVISENRFFPDAGLVAASAGAQSSLRLQNNPNAIETTVTGNDFSGHTTAIRAENYPGLSIVGNGFVPGADESYRHIVVSNRVNASNYIAPLEIDVAIDGNGFFGNAETGVAVAFDNHNCCDDVGSGNTTATFGELRLGGTMPNEFDGSLSQYIVLDDAEGLINIGGLAQSEAQPFFADVNAVGNIWNGVAGADQDEAQRAATRARIVDSRVNEDLGDVMLDFLGATVEGTTSVQGIGAPVLAVPGVTVTALDDGAEISTVQSGAGGAYVLADLPDSTVDVQASLSGFVTASQSVSSTEGGTTTGVDFLLDSAVDAAFSASAEAAPLNGQRFFADREVNDVDLTVTRIDGGPDVDFYVSLSVFDSLGNEIDYINDGLFSMDTLIALDGLLGEGNNFPLPGNASIDLLSGATLEIGPNADQLDVATLSFRLIDGRFGASGSRIVHAATNFAVTIDPAPSVTLQGLETSVLTAEFSTEVVASASGYEGLTPAQVAATAVDAASKEAFLLTFFDFNPAELALIGDWDAVVVAGTDTELSLTFNPGLFEKSYALDLGNTGASRIDAAWAGSDKFETLSGKAIDGPAESAFKLEFTVPYSDTTGVDYSAPVTTTFIDAAKPLIRPFAPGIESGTSTTDPVVINYATGSYATGLVAEYSRNGDAPVSYTSGQTLTAAGDYELTVANVANPNVEPGASTTIRFTIEAGLLVSIDGPLLAPLAEPVFYSVTLENNLTTDPGENVEARLTVARPGIAAGDLVVDYCADSQAAGMPENCADWIALNLVEDGGSLTGTYGPSAGFPVPAEYEATTFFRVSFVEAGNYDAEVSISGIDSGELLATDQLTITVTELSFEIEAGVDVSVDDSDAGFAYYTAELANLGDELPEPVRLYIEVRDSDGLIVDDANAFEYWNVMTESWDSLAYDIDDQRWAFGPTTGFVIDDGYFAATAVRADFPNGLYDLVVTVETADRDADPIWTYGLFERQIAVISEDVDLEFELSRGVTAGDTPPRWDYFSAVLGNEGGATPDNIVLYVDVDGTDFGAGDRLQFWNGSAWSDFGYDAGREAWFLGRDGAGGVSGFPIEAGEVFPIELRVNFLPAEYDFTVSVESIDDSIVGVGGIYAVFAETVDVLPTPASITFEAADLNQVFDGSTKSVGVTTAPEADLDVAISFDPAPPVDAGSYLVEAEITDPYFVGSASATLVIEPAVATVDIDNLLQVFDGDPKPVTVTTTPADLNVIVTYNGDTAVPADAGSYDVVVVIDENNYVGSATATLVIEPAEAVITIDGLSQVFDGDPKPVTVTTVPADLNVIVTYAGDSMAPTDAGEYLVEVTVDEANYVGTASGTLVIEPAEAVITIDGLSQVFDGDPKPVTVTTVPSGLNVIVTYAGDGMAPTDAGEYLVEVTVDEANYIGAASATLVVDPAEQTIDFPALPDRTADDAPFTIAATATSGLAVEFTLVSGPATVMGNEVTLTGDTGEVIIEASQAGDNNWLPADAVQQSFNVTAGVAANIEAASDVDISGQAGSPVAAADLPTVRVTDANGNPVAGVTVGFEVASGGGSVSGAIGQTDSDGLFQLGSWTLGAAASQVVEANAPGLSGGPVAFTATVGAVADVSISVDDNRSSIEVGERNTYVIVVGNAGPSDVDDGSVIVNLPPELDVAGAEWNCFPAMGASCTASGSGDIADSIELPAGSSLVYLLEADVLLGPTQTIVVEATVELGEDVIPLDPDAVNDSTVTQVIVTEDRIFSDRFEDGGFGPTGASVERSQLQGFLQLPQSRDAMGSVETLLSGRDRDNATVFRAVVVEAAGQSRIRLSLRAADGEWAHSNWQPLDAEDRYLAFDFDAKSGLVILAGEQLELLVTQPRAVRPYQRMQTHPSVQLVQ